MTSLLSEEDLNDFITPSLACTRPTETKVSEPNVNELGEYEVGKESETLQKVNITLSDCLACSGCITSSEEIMLQKHSHSVFLEAMNRDHGPLCVSVAAQCRISMSQYFGMELMEFDMWLINFFKERFQAKYVVGLQNGRNITIKQTIEKLVEWKQREQDENSKPRLSSVCPGFLIYTEKTKPGLVPLLLNVKSPQQITGSLLKEVDSSMYHLSISPLFDKKLEAERPDSANEVDCVITPMEFLAMIEDLKIDISDYCTKDKNLLVDYSPPGWDPSIHWASNSGSSSGGFAYQYVEYMRRNHVGNCEMQVLPGKNGNILEYRLVDDERKTIASASELSGFRNIQNMVRNLTGGNKRKIQVLRKRTGGGATGIRHSDGGDKVPKQFANPFKSDFIEVNASPGGCINGSGLINMESNAIKRKQYTQHIEQLYFNKLQQIDPINMMNEIQANKNYEYEFMPAVPQEPKDIPLVGRTW
ncbi:hypothetical protein KAFR_0A08060 [Kazachstania africana CBS 2517]|uniref:Cytosolic Fe-S cluster assembly factor NAR1 n=1 Tax=Kazachstania africana (strain ATCC 22294 / BCRC 22015 / CBS 2517 / CECT 1963 / NBRC 1671 / NRRL Y-8276) TaxID=1071382 RepID=H2APE0_KAZAF|nr:hypothetical protein KAFR_0A08060 [Kazachstania africana CBS 2517]CCF56240.1 hypothetical protein KAFR_0A08060 [Kazachstania africana CBS 2517]